MSEALRPIAEAAWKRVDQQTDRINVYAEHWKAFFNRQSFEGNTFGTYPDGRPALKDMADLMRTRMTERPATNLVKPIIEDAVATSGTVPTITFEPEDESDESVRLAALNSDAVRGQWELSQMDVSQANATWFRKLYGEVCYTLDPMSEAEAKGTGDPFMLPGVRINVIDPSTAYPQFGSGSQWNRIQDLFIFRDEVPMEEVETMYPDAMKEFSDPNAAVTLITHYTKKYKCTLLQQGRGSAPIEAYREDYTYGFVPAEWSINKPSGGHWGLSEVDQASGLQRTQAILFQLAIDSVIWSVFPVFHVHQAEHVGDVVAGPGAVIETSEDGKVEILQPLGDSQSATGMLAMVQDNLLKQSGVSPIRIEGAIKHSNISQRAQSGAQEPQQQRVNLSAIMLGSSLQWLNSKIAYILQNDPKFKNKQMSVYVTRRKGQPAAKVNFTGKQLGELWRNRVQWGNLLGGDEHEQLVMALQLEKDGLYSGRKVLEAIGDDSPERTLTEALEWQRSKAQAAQGAQGPPQPPGGGSPTEAADQGVGMMSGAMPKPPHGGTPGEGAPPLPPMPASNGAPTNPAPIPPPPPMPSAPGGSPTAGPQGIDVWQMVQQALTQSNPALIDEIVEVIGIPGGIYVQVTDQRYVPQIRTILQPVAEEIAGPDGKAEVSVTPFKRGKK